MYPAVSGAGAVQVASAQDRAHAPNRVSFVGKFRMLFDSKAGRSYYISNQAILWRLVVKKTQLLLFGLVLSGLLISVSAYASGSGESASSSSKQPVKLTAYWWGTQDRHTITIDALKLFEKDNPNVQITPVYSGWNGYWDKLNVQVSGGDAPDLFQMAYFYLSDYAQRGAVADLSNVGIDFSNISNSSKDIGEINGKIYALPAGINANGLVYDKSMFAKAGITLPQRMTWKQFADITTEYAKKMGNGQYGAPDDMGSSDMLVYYMRERGYNMYEGNKLGFPKQALIDYFTYWDNLRKAGGIPPAAVTASIAGGELQKTLIVQGKSPITWVASNQISSMEQLSGKTLSIQMWPYLQGGKEAAYLSAGVMWSIYSKSKNLQETGKLLNFLTNNLAAGKILGANRGVPISSAVRNELKASLKPVDVEQFDYIDALSKVATPFSPIQPTGAPQVNTLLTNVAQEIQFGKKSVSAAADEFYTQANDDLARAASKS